MRKPRQLTLGQRYQIAILLKAGHNQAETAKQLDIHKSTISRELHRNRGKRGYRPKQAQKFADARRFCAQNRIPRQTWLRVEQLLREDWSPQQISHWLLDNEGLGVSHERIYQHIKDDKIGGGDLYRHLRCQKKRRKRYGTPSRRGHIRNRVCIDQRPDVVDKRLRIGDWEADTLIGTRKAGKVLATLAERKSRYCMIVVSEDKKASSVSRAILDAAAPVSENFVTVTCDNGKEFALHEELSTELEADWYFAHPYHSWERGLNENTNGLIRQYFPKGMDFTKLTQKDANRVMDKLNNRPRKCLGFKTPNQVFFGTDPPVAFGT